jgi:hypothetical protein
LAKTGAGIPTKFCTSSRSTKASAGEPAPGVDEARRAQPERAVGRPGQRLAQRRNATLEPEVVLVQKADELPAGLADGEIGIRDPVPAPGAVDAPEAAVARVRVDDPVRCVAGAVVGHDDLDAVVALGEDRLECRREEALAVVDRHDDREPRHAAHPPLHGRRVSDRVAVSACSMRG